MNPRRAVLWTLLAVSLPAALPAATVITLEEKSAQGSFDNKVYLQGSKLRVESASGGRPHVVLYDAASGSFRILDPAKKTWFDLPADSAAQQAIATQKLMERKDLSEARKKQILDNMKANAERHGMFGGPATPAQYRKVASGVVVNGLTADEYEVSRDGKKVREVWLADPGSVGIDPADVATFKSLGEKMGARFTGPGRASGFAWEAGAPAGLPVRVVSYVNGQKSVTMEVSAVRHEDVAASLFEVPKEYHQTRLGH
ncbi:MAG: hypothetical protein QOF89_4743 [Acidobacteriota bacterium]|jgi:hypothetical protein|nr:hypothetical protein [Acidobacteriota bacterium]